MKKDQKRVGIYREMDLTLVLIKDVSGTDGTAEPGTCPCHSEALACPHPLYIRRSPSTKLLLAHLAPEHQHSNKRLTITPSYIQEYNIIIYLCMRHGGSAELAPPVAIED